MAQQLSLEAQQEGGPAATADVFLELLQQQQWFQEVMFKEITGHTDSEVMPLAPGITLSKLGLADDLQAYLIMFEWMTLATQLEKTA